MILPIPKWFIRSGVAPNRIDILTSISGVQFFTAWQNKVKAKYGDTPIHIISVKDFLRNKRIVGRPQDISDVYQLQNAVKFQKSTRKQKHK